MFVLCRHHVTFKTSAVLQTSNDISGTSGVVEFVFDSTVGVRVRGMAERMILHPVASTARWPHAAIFGNFE